MGVPQGSVLRSPLWNILYDDLKIQLPTGADMVAFADDAGLIISGKNLEEIRGIVESVFKLERLRRHIAINHRSLRRLPRVIRNRPGDLINLPAAPTTVLQLNTGKLFFSLIT